MCTYYAFFCSYIVVNVTEFYATVIQLRGLYSYKTRFKKYSKSIELQGEFKTEIPLLNGKINRSNISYKWVSIVIFLTWYRHFLIKKMVDYPLFLSFKLWLRFLIKNSLHYDFFLEFCNFCNFTFYILIKLKHVNESSMLFNIFWQFELFLL